jgi:hypothetical protein
VVDRVRRRLYRWEASRHRARRRQRSLGVRNAVRRRPQRPRSAACGTSSTSRRTATSSTTDPSESSAPPAHDGFGVARRCARLERERVRRSAITGELSSKSYALRSTLTGAAFGAWEVIA